MRTHCTPRTLQDLPVKTRLGFYQDVVDSLAEEYMAGQLRRQNRRDRGRHRPLRAIPGTLNEMQMVNDEWHLTWE